MDEPKVPASYQMTSGAAIAPIVPRSIEEALRLARAIVRAGLAPSSYEYGWDEKDAEGNSLKGVPDPEKVMLGIMKGLEVGLAPLTALSTIAIINKRPTIWGDGAIALVHASRQLEKMEEREIGAAPEGDGLEGFGPDYGYEIRMYRRGNPEPFLGKFTVGDARRAKLWANPKKDPWMLYPKRMLRMRAIGFAIRNGFADCLAGMMIREEVEDMSAPVQLQVSTSFLDDAPAIEHKPDEPLDVWALGDDFTAEKFDALLADVLTEEDVVKALAANPSLTDEQRSLIQAKTPQ
jgi:hypothetical protein